MKSFQYILFFLTLFFLGSSLYFFNKSKAISKKYEEEKVLFDARYGEIINVKDDMAAYKDSCNHFRRNYLKLVDSLNKVKS